MSRRCDRKSVAWPRYSKTPPAHDLPDALRHDPSESRCLLALVAGAFGGHFDARDQHAEVMAVLRRRPVLP